MDEVIREGLDCAQEFLEGLLEHLGLDGYYDPKAGHVSTQFVLDRINDARNVCDQFDGLMAPCGHHDTDPLDPAASPGELSHPTQDRAAPSDHSDGDPRG